MCYERSGVFSIDQVLGNPWNSSARYQNFRRSLRCIECGLLGLYFARERSKYQDTTKYHYNLYGIGPDGKEVMLTKDHIIPKSHGGSNASDNMQTMCKPCNERKGNLLVPACI